MKLSFFSLLTRSSRNKRAFDVEEELRFHVEMLERTYAQQGMSDAHAKAAALKRFGNVESIKRQCVDISRRNSRLRRVLKISLILTALAGLAIQTLSSDYKVAQIGVVFIMIAVSGRLLLYVRGARALTFLPGTKQTSFSLFTDRPEDRARN